MTSSIKAGWAGVGATAIATTAMLFATAPAASAAPSGDDGEGRSTARAEAPFFGARIAPTLEGATVIHVVEGGPADDAGIKVGDLVAAIEGVSIDHKGAVREALEGVEPGDSIEIDYSRDGAALTATLVVGAPEDRPAPPAPEDVPWVGARLVHIEGDDGVLVRAVLDDSPAADAGLAAGDTVTAIEGQEVTDWWQAREILADFEPGDTVTISVERDGSTLSLELVLGSAADAPTPRLGDGMGRPGEGHGERGGDTAGAGQAEGAPHGEGGQGGPGALGGPEAEGGPEADL